MQHIFLSKNAPHCDHVSSLQMFLEHNAKASTHKMKGERRVWMSGERGEQSVKELAILEFQEHEKKCQINFGR